MISFRQLLIIALVIGLLWLFSQFRQRLRGVRTAAPAPFRDTVRCRHCGVYLPREDAGGDSRHGFACHDPACIAQRTESTESPT